MSFFDEAVDFFDHVQSTSFYRELLDEFVGFLRVAPDMVVLDVGCGPGYLTRALAGRVKAVACVDLSPNMIERARRHAAEAGLENASYSVGSATSLPEKSEFFDLVVSTSVVYFLEQPVRALREMARVVKPGGAVAMLNPSDAMTWPAVQRVIRKRGATGFEAEALEDWLSAASGARRFSEETAGALMSEAGLTDIMHERHLEGLVLFSKGRKTV